MSERPFSHRNESTFLRSSRQQTSSRDPFGEHPYYRTMSPASPEYSRAVERSLFPEKGLADDAWRQEEDPVFAPWKPAPPMPWHDDPDWEPLTDKWWKARERQTEQERASWARGEGPPVPSRPSFSYATREAKRWQREHIENGLIGVELRQRELDRMKRSMGEGVISAETVLPRAYERRNREELLHDEARTYYAPPLSDKRKPYTAPDHLPRIPLDGPREKLDDLERELDEMESRAGMRRQASVEGALNPGHRQPEKFSGSKRKGWEMRHDDHVAEAMQRAEAAWEAGHPSRKIGDDEYWRVEERIADRVLSDNGYVWKPNPDFGRTPFAPDGQWVLPEKRPGEDRPHGPRPAQKPHRLQDDARRAAEARRDRLSDDLREEELF